MVEFMEVEELAGMVRECPESVIIVDVRQHDYTGGKLKGSINIPFDLFPEPAIQQLQEMVNTLKPKVIVTHCHYCQTRGPKAARMVAESGRVGVPVVYLVGGWDAWYSRFHADLDLIEAL